MNNLRLLCMEIFSIVYISPGLYNSNRTKKNILWLTYALPLYSPYMNHRGPYGTRGDNTRTKGTIRVAQKTQKIEIEKCPPFMCIYGPNREEKSKQLNSFKENPARSLQSKIAGHPK